MSIPRSRFRTAIGALVVLALVAWTLGSVAHQGHGAREIGHDCGACQFAQMAMADQLPAPAVAPDLLPAGTLAVEPAPSAIGFALPARASRAPPSC